MVPIPTHGDNLAYAARITWPFAALLLAILGNTAGCTTSRAVLLCHEGWQAETRGDTARALARYTEALDRNSKLLPAAMGRVRLIALQPERRAEADALLAKFLATNASDPAVAAFAARWALFTGDVRLARQRLVATRAIAPEDPPETAHALAAAEVAVAAAENRWQVASERAVALAVDATRASAGGPETPRFGTDALLLATVAWNVGQEGEARALAGTAAMSPQRQLILALAAREANDWAGVELALASLEGDAVTPLVLTLRSLAAGRRGDAGAAMAAAAEAARRDPADAFVTEVWANAQLGAGQVTTARDLLAGLTARGAGWSAWHGLGIAHVRLGDLAAAAQAFDTATVRCPTCAAPVRNRNVLRRLGF